MRSKFKILCTLFCLLMCFACFVSASGVDEILRSLLMSATDNIYETDFSSMENTIVKECGSGSVLIENDALVIERQQGTRVNLPDEVRLYMNEEKTPAHDENIGIDFRIKRSDAKKLIIDFRDNADKNITGIEFQQGAGVSFRYRDALSEKATEKININNSPINEYIDVQVIINQVAKTVNIWFDGETVLEKKFYEEDAGNFAYISAELIGYNCHKVSFDSMRVYTAQITDEDSVNMDYAWLEYESFGIEPQDEITSDFALPTGKYGSTITWTTSDAAIIAIVDGKADVRPSSEGVGSCVLTATISCGDAQPKERSYNLKVKQLVYDQMPEPLDGYIINNDLKGNAFPAGFYKTMGSPISGTSGITLNEGDGITVTHGAKADTYSVPLAYSFKLEGDGTRIDIYDTDENICFSLKLEDNKIYALTRTEHSAQAQWEVVKNGITGASATIAIDPLSGHFALWYGDECLLNDAIGAMDATLISKLLFVQTSGSLVLSDFKSYVASLPDEQAVLFDYAYLTKENLTWQNTNEILDDIKLYTKGNSGADISWTTSNDALITESGRVTMPDSAQPVTLTATISKGTEEAVREFNLTVVPREQSEMPEIVEMLYEEDFDGNRSKQKWELVETDGIANIKNEKMVVNRKSNTIDEEGNATYTRAFLYLGEKMQYFNGIYGLEFTIRKDDDKALLIRSSGQNSYFCANWYPEGDFRVYYSTEKGVEAKIKQVENIGTEAKITILFNTIEKTFSMWIDGKMVLDNVYARSENPVGIREIYFVAENENYVRAEIDNLRFYESRLISKDRVKSDKEWLKYDNIVDAEDSASDYGETEDGYHYVSKDIILPTTGKFGSSIVWSSSDGIISVDNENGIGNVTQAEGEQRAILTATIKSGDFSDTKEFKLALTPAVSGDESIVNRTLDMISLQRIAELDNGSDKIKQSLNLVSRGVENATISWKSSDEIHITNGGRVTRPKFDEENAEVTLTATVQCGNVTKTKEFNFTVLKDEPFTDPQAMSDEEFFGVYENGVWTTEGKFDYEYRGLQKVRDAVKETGASGDYTKAKEALLDYFRNIRKSSTTVSSRNRDVGWANMVVDNFFHYAKSSMYQGEINIPNQWSEVAATVRSGQTAPGGTVAYSVRAWYNEASYAEIAGVNHPDESMRPKLELKVNGEIRYVEAADDAMIRAGEFKRDNYAGQEIIKVQNYGEFEGNNLSHMLLKFDLSEFSATDTISSARLILHARTVPHFAGEKRLIICLERDNSWTNETVTYASITGYIYSSNGLEGGNPWQHIEGADNETFWQSTRFVWWENVAATYLYTRDEEYAYKAQRIAEDFLTDSAYFKSSDNGTNGHDPNGIRGGFPRSLDMTARISAWGNTMDIFMDSKYATPDYCTAMLKSLWDSANYLTYIESYGGNWKQAEKKAVLSSAFAFPEFKDARDGRNWYETGIHELEDVFFLNTHIDGSYMEPTYGYTTSQVGEFFEFKETLMASGGDVSDAYNERLVDLAYYYALLHSPDGISVDWGDVSGNTKISKSTYGNFFEWFDEPELLYIVTQGKEGTKPEWTSKNYYDSEVTSMRAGWSKDSPFLFTSVRGGGSHSHQDANSIEVHGYERVLLSDSGTVSYDGTDPVRQWAASNEGHNTVIINDARQNRFFDREQPTLTTGKIYDFSTNKSFDYLSQSTPSNPGFEHRRSIIFIKPDIFIVNDLVIPENQFSPNNYKQLWHMLPDANMKIDENTNTIYSDFESGANVYVASADSDDVRTGEKQGWYSFSYGSYQENPYGYFETKEKVVGNATLNTVIMLDGSGDDAGITAEKMYSGDDRVALKLNIKNTEGNFTGYYHMSYDGTGAAFGPYETDAQIAYVQENEQGKIVSVLLRKGTYVRRIVDNTDIYRSTSATEEIYIDMSGHDIFITAVGEGYAGATFLASNDFSARVFVNDVNRSYVLSWAHIGSIGTTQTPSTQGGSNISGVTGAAPTPGGDSSGGGGGGGGGGGSTDDKKPDDKDDSEKEPDSENAEKSFPDVKSHWAEEYIGDLLSKGIVNGDENGNFNPDNSIKRSEFIAIAVRSAALDMSEYKGSFTDVSDEAWYADVIQTALDNGIISADTNFRPDDLITREEMAKIISGIAKLEEHYDKEIVLSDTYTDSQNISDWAKVYVKYISSSGLMKGREDGSFAPKDGATRAEAAAVIGRWLKMAEE